MIGHSATGVLAEAMNNYLSEVQLITVSPSQTRARLRFGNVEVPCAIGRSGIVQRKREGDGGTPIGVWPMRRILYRPDRVRMPVSGLPVWALEPDDGWSDDPKDPSRYNRPVRLPYPYSHERMWRDDHLYDIVVVLGHNDSPPVAGMGSAIFMHIAREDYGPTEGCIALRQEDLLRVVSRCAEGTVVRVGQ